MRPPRTTPPRREVRSRHCRCPIQQRILVFTRSIRIQRMEVNQGSSTDKVRQGLRLENHDHHYLIYQPGDGGTPPNRLRSTHHPWTAGNGNVGLLMAWDGGCAEMTYRKECYWGKYLWRKASFFASVVGISCHDGRMVLFLRFKWEACFHKVFRAIWCTTYLLTSYGIHTKGGLVGEGPLSFYPNPLNFLHGVHKFSHPCPLIMKFPTGSGKRDTIAIHSSRLDRLILGLDAYHIRHPVQENLLIAHIKIEICVIISCSYFIGLWFNYTTAMSGAQSWEQQNWDFNFLS